MGKFMEKLTDEKKDRIAQRNAAAFCKRNDIRNDHDKAIVLRAMRAACDKVEGR